MEQGNKDPFNTLYEKQLPIPGVKIPNPLPFTTRSRVNTNQVNSPQAGDIGDFIEKAKRAKQEKHFEDLLHQEKTPRDFHDNINVENTNVELKPTHIDKVVIKSPNVVAILGGIMVVVIILIISLFAFYPTCMTGNWLTPTKEVYYITHNRFTGNFTIEMNGKKYNGHCTYSGVMTFYDKVGVWDKQDTISFGDAVWVRVK